MDPVSPSAVRRVAVAFFVALFAASFVRPTHLAAAQGFGGIASLFSYHRWNAILQNLHFADRASDFPCDEAGLPYEKCPADKRNWDIQGFQDILEGSSAMSAEVRLSVFFQ